jgi:Putative member of DMT superfamily (DUF486)
MRQGAGLRAGSSHPVILPTAGQRLEVVQEIAREQHDEPSSSVSKACPLAPAELKTIQEVITLVVFASFTTVYFNEPLSLTQGAGFALIALGAMLVFRGQL